MPTPAERAARWWRQEIEAESAWWDARRNGPIAEDDPPAWYIAHHMPTMFATKEQLDLFEAELFRRIASDYCYISSDYAPQGILADACEAAGIPFDLVPRKTRLWIEGEAVTFARGRGAKPEELEA